MSSVKKAVLRTLCYSDIFDYPLTASEIFLYLISKQRVSRSSLRLAFESLKKEKKIEEKKKYFFLYTRQNLFAKRIQRKIISQKKQAIASRVADLLKLIPSIQAIALTGASAMENADTRDDVDLMIITSTNRLWLTRLLIVPLISVVANRRKPTIYNPQLIYPEPSRRTTHQDAICLNLWLDEASLLVPKSKQNLYTAHEVIQTKFLWSRGDTQKMFLSQNSWITNYLPNIKLTKNQKTTTKKPRNLLFIIHNSLFSLLEFVVFQLQLNYMRSKKTREIVSSHAAYFHPQNTSEIVLNKYKIRLKLRSIP